MDDGHHPPEEQAAGMAKSRITDPFCALVFIAYLVGMGYIFVDSVRQGNVRRLTHGFNFRGELCGVDKNVSLQPYLYWCGGEQPAIAGIPQSLNLKSPVCVSKCPTGANSSDIYCPMPSQTEVTQSGQGQAITQTTVIVSRVIPQTPYPTKLKGGLYCIPDTAIGGNSIALASSLYDGADAPLGNFGAEVMGVIGSVKRAWKVFLATTAIAVIVSYIFLFALKHCAKVIILGTLALMVATQILLGLSLISTAFNIFGQQVHSPLFQRYPHAQAVQYSLIIGSIALVLGVITGCILCFVKHSINVAVACVETAVECMFEMPSLMLQPLLGALMKLLIAVLLLIGFAYLMSCGTITSESATIGGSQVNGLKRSFSYTQEQGYMIAFYIFGYIWSLEFCNALNLFVISYAVTLWFYKPKQGGKKMAPRGAALRGLVKGLFYHTGSLAFGALLIAIVSIIAGIFNILAKEAKAKNAGLLAVIFKCLECCVRCFESVLKYITKNAYIDICIKSDDFCTAAKHSFEFIQSCHTTILILNGACFIIQAIGSVTVGTLGGLATYAIITSWSRYTSDSSPHHVADPTAVGILAGLLSFGIGLMFMHVFDQCADTLLYLFEDMQQNNRGNIAEFAPATLSSLVERTKRGDTYEPLSQSDPGTPGGRAGE